MMSSVKTREAVRIPDGNGGVRETVWVEVEAERDDATGETYLTGESLAKLDKAKARYLGVILPAELRELRCRFGFSQREMGRLLGTGEKTYCRWETGRERPSQSLNRMLVALRDGRLSLEDLMRQQPGAGPADWLLRGERSRDTRGRSLVCSEPSGPDTDKKGGEHGPHDFCFAA